MTQCKTCGAELVDGAVACFECGEPIDGSSTGARRARDEWHEKRRKTAGVKMGFSKVFDTPEFQECLAKGNKSNTVAAFVVSLVIAVITAAIGVVAFKDLAAGVILGVVIFVFCIAIMVPLVIKRNVEKPWDGEVIDQYEKIKGDTVYFYIVCRTDEGKTEKVRDLANGSMYDLLEVGDRVRFHPRLNSPLEKYDKTRDSFLVCSFCGSKSPIDKKRCQICGKLLLK